MTDKQTEPQYRDPLESALRECEQLRADLERYRVGYESAMETRSRLFDDVRDLGGENYRLREELDRWRGYCEATDGRLKIFENFDEVSGNTEQFREGVKYAAKEIRRAIPRGTE